MTRRTLAGGCVALLTLGVLTVSATPVAASCTGGKLNPLGGGFTCTETTPTDPPATVGTGTVPVSIATGGTPHKGTGTGGITEIPTTDPNVVLVQRCDPVCHVAQVTKTPQKQAPAAPKITPAQAAQTALARLTFTAAAPGMGPDHSINGLHDDETGKAFDNAVGYPVWLWADGGDTDTRSVSDNVDGNVVAITVRFTGTSWSMGDGTTVNCGAGTRWTRASTPGAHSPAHCDHVYEKRGPKTVTVTTNWSVDLRSGTYAATVPVAIDRSRPFRVGELQVLVQ